MTEEKQMEIEKIDSIKKFVVTLDKNKGININFGHSGEFLLQDINISSEDYHAKDQNLSITISLSPAHSILPANHIVLKILRELIICIRDNEFEKSLIASLEKSLPAQRSEFQKKFKGIEINHSELLKLKDKIKAESSDNYVEEKINNLSEMANQMEEILRAEEELTQLKGKNTKAKRLDVESCDFPCGNFQQVLDEQSGQLTVTFIMCSPAVVIQSFMDLLEKLRTDLANKKLDTLISVLSDKSNLSRNLPLNFNLKMPFLPFQFNKKFKNTLDQILSDVKSDSKTENQKNIGSDQSKTSNWSYFGRAAFLSVIGTFTAIGIKYVVDIQSDNLESPKV